MVPAMELPLLNTCAKAFWPNVSWPLPVREKLLMVLLPFGLKEMPVPVVEATEPVSPPLSTRTVLLESTVTVAAAAVECAAENECAAIASIEVAGAGDIGVAEGEDAPETSAETTPLLMSVPPVKKLNVAPVP